MTGNLGYPSTFAIGLTFWAWALTGTFAGGIGGPVRYVGPSGLRSLSGYKGLGVLYGLILLVHPITASAAALGAVAFVAGWQRGWRAAVAARWAITGAAALMVAHLWPVLRRPHAARGPQHGRHAPAAVRGGARALLAGADRGTGRTRRPRARRSWRDPLVLMFALDCLAVAYGWVSGHYTYGRILGIGVCGAAVRARDRAGGGAACGRCGGGRWGRWRPSAPASASSRCRPVPSYRVHSIR